MWRFDNYEGLLRGWKVKVTSRGASNSFHLSRAHLGDGSLVVETSGIVHWIKKMHKRKTNWLSRNKRPWEVCEHVGKMNGPDRIVQDSWLRWSMPLLRTRGVATHCVRLDTAAIVTKTLTRFTTAHCQSCHSTWAKIRLAPPQVHQRNALLWNA